LRQQNLQLVIARFQLLDDVMLLILCCLRLAELLHHFNLVTCCLLQRLLSFIKLGLQQQQQPAQ
jgi:hypothetical protein